MPKRKRAEAVQSEDKEEKQEKKEEEEEEEEKEEKEEKEEEEEKEKEETGRRRSTRTSTKKSTAASEKKKKAPRKKEPAPKRARTSKKDKEKEKEKEEKKEGELDFAHLDSHSIAELKKYTTEKGLQLDGPLSRKRTYIQAIKADKEGKKPKKEGEEEGEEQKLWEGWKEIYLVGTEWHLYDDVFTVEWDFSQLQADLEEGGRLFEKGKEHPVYIFGTTEPQMLSYDPADPSKQKVIPVPVVVAIISSLPAPPTLGLNSVQKEKEEIIPMSELKMAWVPYVPKGSWRVDPLTQKPLAYFLKTTQRRTALKKLKEEQLRRFEYALPYIFLPRVQEEPTPNSEVSVLLEIEGMSGKIPPVTFDWQFDELEDFTDQVIKDCGLEEKHKDSIRQQVRDQVNERKRGFREEKAAWQARLNGLSEKEKKALDELKCIKYYPKNKVPDLSQVKSNFINRYYGKADELP